MTILSIICGILMILAGIVCVATPLATYMSTGYFIVFLLLVYGVIGIIRFFQKRAGALELAVSILAVIVGVVSLFRPGQVLVFDKIGLILIATWLFIQGIVTLVTSIRYRIFIRGWGWGVFAGILGIVAGLYSYVQPKYLAVTAGVLIGLYFIEVGINMIVLGSFFDRLKNSFQDLTE